MKSPADNDDTHGCLQIQRQQQLSSIKKTVEQEFAQELADLTPLGVEAKLRAKLESTQYLIDQLNQQSSATTTHQQTASLFLSLFTTNIFIKAPDL